MRSARRWSLHDGADRTQQGDAFWRELRRAACERLRGKANCHESAQPADRPARFPPPRSCRVRLTVDAGRSCSHPTQQANQKGKDRIHLFLKSATSPRLDGDTVNIAQRLWCVHFHDYFLIAQARTVQQPTRCRPAPDQTTSGFSVTTRSIPADDGG